MTTTQDVRPRADPQDTRKLRVVVASRGSGEHDRDASFIADALSDLDLEVTHTGLDQSPQEIVDTVIRADAAALALPIASAARLARLPQLAELLQDVGVDDVLMTLGEANVVVARLDASRSLQRSASPRASAREVIDSIESRLGLVPAQAIRVLRGSLTARHRAVGAGNGNAEAIWAFFALSPAGGARP
jgi:methylmalonyl-CoA mutase cobalamin-binding domain/chain